MSLPFSQGFVEKRLKGFEVHIAIDLHEQFVVSVLSDNPLAKSWRDSIDPVANLNMYRVLRNSVQACRLNENRDLDVRKSIGYLLLGRIRSLHPAVRLRR